ncbi:MAG TPA: VOC family protein [Streptosporangiaceae bacterium]
MPPIVVRSMIAVTYVRDIDASRAFYGRLGFVEHSSRREGGSAWASLRSGDAAVLLAATESPLDLPRLPMLFYFFFEDLEAVLAGLAAAGLPAERLGSAPHALGGEARVTDPDGNTVLLGQREASAAGRAGPDEVESRFSVLREAASLVAAQGGATVACEAGDPQGGDCGRTAEVRLADSAGTAIWACLSHAEEILVVVNGAFVASDEADGIAGFLARRQ